MFYYCSDDIMFIFITVLVVIAPCMFSVVFPFYHLFVYLLNNLLGSIV